MGGNQALAVLRGGHLDTVAFVMDYAEFRIGYSVPRAIASPVVELADGGRFRFPESGSRDALCRLIDTTLESAEERGTAEEGDLRIEVRLDRGHLLTIPSDDDLAAVDRVGASGAGGCARRAPGRAEMFVWD